MRSRNQQPHGAKRTKEAVNEHGLTALQEEFCHAYLIRFNVSKAEALVGVKKGTGNKWMTDLKVRERINAIRVETGKAFDVTRERMLQELMNIIYANPKNFVGDDIVKWPDEDMAAIAGIEYDLMGAISAYKRWDKLKAMEIVNKMLGYNMPELSKVVAVNVPVDKDEMIEIAKQLKSIV